MDLMKVNEYNLPVGNLQVSNLQVGNFQVGYLQVGYLQVKTSVCLSNGWATMSSLG
jgi:hypothetical protein